MLSHAWLQCTVLYTIYYTIHYTLYTIYYILFPETIYLTRNTMYYILCSMTHCTVTLLENVHYDNFCCRAR